MQPPDFYHYMLVPSLKVIEKLTGIADTDEARAMLMAIAGQESNWAYRMQVPVDYAHSYYMFEKGGGVAGVLSHPASSGHIQTVCKALDISCDTDTVYVAMSFNGILATTMARLLLYTDPASLPALGAVDQAYETYDRNWRPGSKRPGDWPENYNVGLDLITPDHKPRRA